MLNRFRRIVIPTLVALLGAAIAIIFTQGNRIRLLEGSVADLEMKSAFPVGLELRQFRVRDLTGRDFQIDFTARHKKPMVIYVLRPSCSICRGNAPSISKLARSLGAEYDVIGLSLERQGLEDLVARENIPFPIYTDVPRDIVRAYGLGGTPQTIRAIPGREDYEELDWWIRWPPPNRHRTILFTTTT